MGIFDGIVKGIADFASGNYVGLVGDVIDVVSGGAKEAAPFASAFGAYKGQEDTNATNIMLAREGQAFNAEQASKQMDFQRASLDKQETFARAALEKQEGFQRASVEQKMAYDTAMSNSSYQRAVQDMKDAGLNPMLAYSQGGASSPTGSASSGATGSIGNAHGASASAVVPTVQNAVLAGVQAGSNAANTVLSTAQAGKAKLEQDEVVERTRKERAEADMAAMTAVPGNFERILRSRILQAEEGVVLTETQIKEGAARIAQLAKQGALTDAETSKVRITTVLSNLEVPHAKAVADYFVTAWGRSQPYRSDLKSGLDTGIRAFGAARGTPWLPWSSRFEKD